MTPRDAKDRLLVELSEALVKEESSKTALTQAENRHEQAKTDRRRILGEILRHTSVGRNVRERILFLGSDDRGRTRQLLLTFKDGEATTKDRVRVQLFVDGESKQELNH